MVNNKDVKGKRRLIRPIIIGGIFVILLITYALMPRNKDKEFNTRSAKARVGSLSVTVVGSGNIEYQEAIDIEIPSNILVEEVLVDSGDLVEEGDILAKLDPISLQREIESVKSQIIDIDKQINLKKEAPKTEKIISNIEGRVKKVYASKEDKVIDVYNNKGALMVLSINGKMAVDFESSYSIDIEDEVTIVLEDGKSLDGLVASESNGEYTVTFTDNGPKLDEVVTIYNKDDQVLGTGQAYISQPLNIIATYGKVQKIHVSENEKVSSTKTLVTIEDIPVSTDYLELIDEREELVDKLNKLLELLKSNSLVSSANGVIQAIYIEEGKATSASETSSIVDSTNNYDLATSSNTSMSLASTQSSSSNMVSAFSIAPTENVVLAISVDELDILSIEKGMSVEVEFDAIAGKTFTGEITNIADTANSSGGVAKYKVEVLMKKDDSMRVGMNARATILVEEKNNILLIPIVALQESSSRVYVYTQQDNETGELTKEVDVTTGISDGEFVEITSGLSEDDTVYYYITSNELFQMRMEQGGRRGLDIPNSDEHAPGDELDKPIDGKGN
ncbi:MAG: HlyD family efflux transporter periplasmic adaptor subunit [Clostridiales bacterium]|nr:HlyD family efflux transporter periplasmic adaptor subunit [Clostridiales bacterium]